MWSRSLLTREFSPSRVCQKLTKRCGGSIEREKVYVTYRGYSNDVINRVKFINYYAF